MHPPASHLPWPAAPPAGLLGKELAEADAQGGASSDDEAEKVEEEEEEEEEEEAPQLPPRAVREAELATRVLGEVPGGAEEMTRLARQRLVKQAKREERLLRKEAQKRSTGERKRMRFKQMKDKKEEKKADRKDAK